MRLAEAAARACGCDDAKRDRCGGTDPVLALPDSMTCGCPCHDSVATVSALAEPAPVAGVTAEERARWAAMAKAAASVPDTGHSQACSCGECGRMWARATALQDAAPELVRAAVPRLLAALTAAEARACPGCPFCQSDYCPELDQAIRERNVARAALAAAEERAARAERERDEARAEIRAIQKARETAIARAARARELAKLPTLDFADPVRKLLLELAADVEALTTPKTPAWSCDSTDLRSMLAAHSQLCEVIGRVPKSDAMVLAWQELEADGWKVFADEFRGGSLTAAEILGFLTEARSKVAPEVWLALGLAAAAEARR